MFGLRKHLESDAALQSIGVSLAVIEFSPDGKILGANANFCSTMGYVEAELVGQHHRMFVDPTYATSTEYRAFWEKLSRGEHEGGEYRRVGKGGHDVWLQASYNPVRTRGGRVVKIMKIAADITAEKLKNLDLDARINAIDRAQGVIEFAPDGAILSANDNFLSVVGYRLEEIIGKKHALFVDPEYGRSSEYQDFWHKLRCGELQSAEFKRVGKNGKIVWIQASYNPIFDFNRKVVRVVKFATDVTERHIAVDAIGEGLSQLAEGNVGFRLSTSFIPAFEPLRNDFNASMDKMQTSLSGVTQTAEAISSGALEISTAADDLSHRTETQAANLEETAAALDQVTRNMNTSASGANNARKVVAAANADARQSAVVVAQTIQAMDAIAKSAVQISQIIGVIDEIAFQTNLLALNAGVEAARAGDAGRGFAVVASEVRALAQRSAEAAKEIKALIMTSSTQVDQGVNLVAETGRSLDRILRQVNDIDNVVREIAAGAQEQANGLSEINVAITQMDKVTQQNAAMVEETTAASHALSKESERLKQLVGYFQLGGYQGHSMSAFATRPNPRENSVALKPIVRLVSAVGGNAVRSEGWEEF